MLMKMKIIVTLNLILKIMEISNISAADKDFLGSIEGFFERYIRNRAYYDKCEDAYERTEAQYEALMGRRRYKNYDTFRSAYSRYYKEKRG